MYQTIIYEKDTGNIVQVMTLRSSIAPKIEKLGLSPRFDIHQLSHLTIPDNMFIDIRKDKVLDGILCVSSDEAVKKPIKYEDMFDDVSKINTDVQKFCHIGIVTPWRQECGIAKYSEDLANGLLNKTTIFSERGDPTSDTKVEVVPCWSRDDTSYTPLMNKIIAKNIDIVHVQYNHGLMNAGEVKKLGDNLRRNNIYTIMTLHSTKGGVEVFANHFNKIVVHIDDMLEPPRAYTRCSQIARRHRASSLN